MVVLWHALPIEMAVYYHHNIRFDDCVRADSLCENLPASTPIVLLGTFSRHQFGWDGVLGGWFPGNQSTSHAPLCGQLAGETLH